MAAKNRLDSVKNITDEIRKIYNSDFSNAETLVEEYLKQLLKERTPDERLNTIKELAYQFKGYNRDEKVAFNIESNELTRLFSLLLGEKILTANLSSTELTENLANSLNTIFDTVNQIISVINITLFGKNTKVETIRGIIGSTLEQGGKNDSLQNYLDQVKEAFLVAHKAFQQSAYTKVRQILDELDPDHISATAKGGLKFGPLLKAKLFKMYKERFNICKGWFESGRFMEELSKEFEKICHQLYKTEKRGTN